MARKFAATLTADEIAFARQCEAAGVCSYSQSVKRLERGERRTLQAELVARIATGKVPASDAPAASATDIISGVLARAAAKRNPGQ